MTLGKKLWPRKSQHNIYVVRCIMKIWLRVKIYMYISLYIFILENKKSQTKLGRVADIYLSQPSENTPCGFFIIGKRRGIIGKNIVVTVFSYYPTFYFEKLFGKQS